MNIIPPKKTFTRFATGLLIGIAITSVALANPPNFSEELGQFWKDGKTGFLDRTGKTVIEPTWDRAGAFKEGLAVVKRNGLTGVIDKSGKLVIPLRKMEISWHSVFEHGVVSAEMEVDGIMKAGVIDQSGKTVIPFAWRNARVIGNGLVHVTKFGRYPNRQQGLYGVDGREILPPEYSYIYTYCDNLIALKDYSSRIIKILDLEGKLVSTFVLDPQWKWHKRIRFQNALIPVQAKNSGKWGYIDQAGIVKIAPRFDDVSRPENRFSGGHGPSNLWVKIDKKWGVIDSTGVITTKPVWDTIRGEPRPGRESKFVFVSLSGKYGLVSIDGKTILSKPVWDEMWEARQRDKYIEVVHGSKRGLIDFEGKPVMSIDWTDKWDQVHILKPNLVMVVRKVGEKTLHGLVDSKNNTLLECEYEYISYKVSEGLITLMKKFGEGASLEYVDESGKILRHTNQ